jgi:hypothetical protein
MEAKLIETQPSNLLPPSQRSVESPSAMDATFLISINLVVILSAIAALTYACIHKRKPPLVSFKLHYKVPCHRCRYFSNGNPYLKCALHPLTVLTEQVVDCKDYCPDTKR